MSSTKDFKDKDLEFWIENNYNVLLIGAHGTGKTARVIEAFEKHKLKWKYFSAATMDPWVDFIGVPKERMTENGIPYLDLVRPRHFAEDDVEAIFMDEFNRSSKKVRNAVMELIQFGSINGKKFPSLRFVWAAINPDDEDKTYDVEALDPAQMDRFHFQVEVSPRPDYFYFKRVYGAENAKAAVEWWDSLEDAAKKWVSPRRLDYALDVFQKGGNIRYVLHKGVNVSSLLQGLKRGSIVDRLKIMRDNNDRIIAADFLRNENNYNAAISHILKDFDNLKFFLPTLTDEKKIALVSSNEEVKKYVLATENFQDFQNVIMEIAKSSSSELAHEAKRRCAIAVPETQVSDIGVGGLFVTDAQFDIKHEPTKSVADFNAGLKALNKKHPDITASIDAKKDAYDFLVNTLPFDLTEDETQQKGLNIALATVDIISKIALTSKRDTLKNMPELGKMLNHVLFYMGVFQRPDIRAESGKATHDPKKFLVQDPQNLQNAIDKLVDDGFVKFGVKTK